MIDGPLRLKPKFRRIQKKAVMNELRKGFEASLALHRRRSIICDLCTYLVELERYTIDPAEWSCFVWGHPFVL